MALVTGWQGALCVAGQRMMGASALQSGALLACGIVNSGVRNECDPALALLSDYVLHNSNAMRIGAIFG